MPAGTLLSEATSKAYALTVNGVDVLPSVHLDVAPVRWTDQAANGVGEMTFVVHDGAAWASRLPLPRGADVRLVDTSQPTPLFGGTLLHVLYSRAAGPGRWAACTVVDHDWWLDHRVVPRFSSRVDTGKKVRRMTSDREMVKALLERRAPMILPSAAIDQTNSNMPLVEVEGTTARGALEAIADAAQGHTSPFPRRFYVDATRHLHWYQTSEGVAAPYDVGPSPDLEVEDLEVEYDGLDVWHHAYVRGKDAAGSGWVYDKGSAFAAGATTTFLDRPKSDTVAERNRTGRAFLRRQQEVVAGSFHVLGTTGWRSGQLLTITDAQLGLSSATYEIATVRGELLPGHHRHHIEFGAPKRWLTRDLRRRDIL